MDAFTEIMDKIRVNLRTILGSPAPEEGGSVKLEFEDCGDNSVIVRGVDPQTEEVLKNLNCDEIEQILALAQAIQQFSGAS